MKLEIAFNPCAHCGEQILPGEQAPLVRGEPLHTECAFRMFAGSVGHLQRRCSCYVPGSAEGDPPGLTRRQAALAALNFYPKRTYENLPPPDDAPCRPAAPDAPPRPPARR